MPPYNSFSRVIFPKGNEIMSLLTPTEFRKKPKLSTILYDLTPVWFLSLTSGNSSIITDCWLATVAFSCSLTTSHLFPISGLLFLLFFLLGITLSCMANSLTFRSQPNCQLRETFPDYTIWSILQTPSWLILLFYFTHSLLKLFFIKFFIFYPNKNVSSTSGETASILFTVKMTKTSHGIY